MILFSPNSLHYCNWGTVYLRLYLCFVSLCKYRKKKQTHKNNTKQVLNVYLHGVIILNSISMLQQLLKVTAKYSRCSTVNFHSIKHINE